MSVEEATRIFGSTLRIHLIRYWRDNPGPQKDAADHLGVSRNVLSDNTRVLLDAGVIYQDDAADGRSHTYRVNEARFLELWQSLRAFGLDTDQ